MFIIDTAAVLSHICHGRMILKSQMSNKPATVFMMMMMMKLGYLVLVVTRGE